jgi:hypothetical protein
MSGTAPLSVLLISTLPHALQMSRSLSTQPAGGQDRTEQNRSAVVRVSQKLRVWASTRAQVAERVADVTLTVNTACGWTEQNRTEGQSRDVPVRRSKTWASACAQVVARLADTLAVHPNLHQVGLPGTHPPPHTIITSCSTTKKCAIQCPPTLPNTRTYHQRASRVAATTSRCKTHCPQHPPSQYASPRTI